MANELDVIRDVCGKLEQAALDYMLTGSIAMNYYAIPRMTRDIDIVIAVQPGYLDRLIELFQPDYYVSREAIAGAIAHSSIFNLIHNESVIKVDCIVKKNTPYRRVEFERRVRISLGDFFVWIVSKEDLIISKLFWARDSHSELQLRDVRNLAKTGCDNVFIEHWVADLGLTTLWRECAESLNE